MAEPPDRAGASGGVAGARAVLESTEEAHRATVGPARDAARASDVATATRRGIAERISTIRSRREEVPDDLDALARMVADAARRLELARDEFTGARAAALALEDDPDAVEAREARAAADGEVTRMEAGLAGRRERLAEVEAMLVDAPALDRLRATLAEVEALDTASREAEQALRVAGEEVVAARAALSEHRERVREMSERLTGIRDSVASLGPPVLRVDDLAAGWLRFRAWAEETSASLETEVLERTRQRAATSDALTGHLEALAALVGEVRRIGSHGSSVEPGPDSGSDSGVDPAGDPVVGPEDAVRIVGAATARAEERFDQLRHRRDEQVAELARIEALRADAAVAGRLGDLMRSNRFEEWFLAEAVHDLAVTATDHLLGLSAGRFSLEAQGTDVVVRDHANADEARSIRSLSGGETFLASLAFALALSDHVAELAVEHPPKVDSIFLDEGFGTLDPDRLDVVASALEELASSGRMVLVVSHVRELAERLPVRFEVASDPSGSTVRRVEE
ncbi:MAG: SMC family ATPase [Microthrixaceae bacterium]